MGVWRGRAALFAAILPLAAFLAVAPAAAETIHLTPTSGGKWMPDPTEDRCRLIRFFGEGKSRSVIYIDQFAPGDTMHLVAAGRPLWRVTRGPTIDVRFGPLPQEPLSVRLHGEQLGDFGPAVYAVNIAPGQRRRESGVPPDFAVDGTPGIDLALARQVGWISFERRGNSVVFDLPSMGDAMLSLNQCTEHMLASWGLDAQQHRTMTRGVEPLNLAEVAEAVQKAYPAEAVRAGREGILVLRVILRADGRLDQCTILEGSKAGGLAADVCDILQGRARFEPARDGRGQPMDSFYASSLIYWVH